MVIISHKTTTKIYRIKDLISVTGLSRSTIYDKLNPKSPRYDSSFPKKIKLGVRAVGWFKEDIMNWLEAQKALVSLTEEIRL